MILRRASTRFHSNFFLLLFKVSERFTNLWLSQVRENTEGDKVVAMGYYKGMQAWVALTCVWFWSLSTPVSCFEARGRVESES